MGFLKKILIINLFGIETEFLGSASPKPETQSGSPYGDGDLST